MDEARAFLDGHAPPSTALAPAPKRQVRPYVEFDPEVAGEVIERLANGESLRRICKDKTLPNKSTVLRWVATNPEFYVEYCFALHARLDDMCDEIIEIADDADDDFIVVPGESDEAKPTLKLNKEALGRTKQRIETRKWVMGKLNSKKYGDIPDPLAAPAGYPGDNAKPVNEPTVIENDPLYEALKNL